ncbi:hypothetical protein GIB67_018574 [Kingdonia uniflora]|uniref:Uncharacterized protein n=1 Tax=Kingdonia uniflora TaxID=39325 RepID=A0A7J7L8C5_9MAGN|nr:hypothetical protein GIB67_018574 [Kingdonia uniflora]
MIFLLRNQTNLLFFLYYPVNNPKKIGPTLNETFLGLLYPTENYKVYGYLTNTKVKFILVTTDLDVRDADVRNLHEREIRRAEGVLVGVAESITLGLEVELM